MRQGLGRHQRSIGIRVQSIEQQPKQQRQGRNCVQMALHVLLCSTQPCQTRSCSASDLHGDTTRSPRAATARDTQCRDGPTGGYSEGLLSPPLGIHLTGQRFSDEWTFVMTHHASRITNRAICHVSGCRETEQLNLTSKLGPGQ